MASTPAEKILARFKNLSQHLQPDEQPLFSMPAIWDIEREKHSTACDIILTNHRLFGYIFTTFPRERFFLDALNLRDIRAVSIREKNFEPLFRELLVSTDQRKVYIRAPRRKIEDFYLLLRSALEEFAPAAAGELETASSAEGANRGTVPTFGRQQIRTPLERSSTGITLLFVGGLALEILAAVAWFATGSLQTGLPLFGAGALAVIVAILANRQRRA